MFLVWLLWIVVVVGGFFMGGASVLSLLRRGFDIVVAGNALVYLGTAVFGLPRLFKLVRTLL